MVYRDYRSIKILKQIDKDEVSDGGCDARDRNLVEDGKW